MAVPIDQDVFRLQVPEQDALGVYVLHRQHELCNDEPGYGLFQVLQVVELLRQITVVYQLHYHVQVVWCLKCVV